jgi:hypothetical protein
MIAEPWGSLEIVTIVGDNWSSEGSWSAGGENSMNTKTLFSGLGRKEDRGGERISQYRLLNSQGDELVFVPNGCSVS